MKLLYISWGCAYSEGCLASRTLRGKVMAVEGMNDSRGAEEGWEAAHEMMNNSVVPVWEPWLKFRRHSQLHRSVV